MILQIMQSYSVFSWILGAFTIIFFLSQQSYEII